MYKIDFSRKVNTDKIPKYDLKRILDKIKELAKERNCSKS
jgi:mRNA-degrading endonuclease RelE of RelBE toxin-antitoxin system